MLTSTPGQALARYDLFSGIDDMRRRMNEMFGSFPSRFPATFFDTENWAPLVDLYQEKDNYVVKADLPGVDPKDVKVTLMNDVLTIEGDRKWKKEIKEESFYFHEARYGGFLRRIALPAGTRPEAVKASFEHGVLEVRVPLSNGFKPTEIPIQST